METLITFIVILAVLILVHELGHFITARRLGVDVEEFAIGFPPRIFSRKIKGVLYSINWIPLGGYVKIKGESGEKSEDPHSFVNQPSWKKLSIVSAGVLMNFVAAFILLSVVFWVGYPQEIDASLPQDKIKDRNVTVLEVVVDSPAYQAGIEVGDNILAVDGQSYGNYEAVHQAIEAQTGQPLELTIEKKNGEIEQYTVEHQVLAQGQSPMIGIGIIDTGIVEYGFFGSIWQGLKVTGLMIGQIINALYHLIANLLTQGQLAAEFGGPVAVAVITGQVVRLGFIHILYFAAILSINLGVINFFPFPALDGGRAIFIALQAIFRRKLDEKVEAWIHNSGFIILVLLLIAITLRDFRNYGGGIWQAVKNWF